MDRHDAADWAPLHARIATEVAGLADGEFVTFTLPAGPQVEPPSHRGLLRRKSPSAPSRYVQFLRMGEVIVGECTGSASFGGDVAMGATDEQRLRAAGWRGPDDTPAPGEAEEPWGYPNFRAHLTRDESARAADLGVAGLAGLRGGPDDEIEVERGR